MPLSSSNSPSSSGSTPSPSASRPSNRVKDMVQRFEHPPASASASQSPPAPIKTSLGAMDWTPRYGLGEGLDRRDVMPRTKTRAMSGGMEAVRASAAASGSASRIVSKPSPPIGAQTLGTTNNNNDNNGDVAASPVQPTAAALVPPSVRKTHAKPSPALVNLPIGTMGQAPEKERDETDVVEERERHYRRRRHVVHQHERRRHHHHADGTRDDGVVEEPGRHGKAGGGGKEGETKEPVVVAPGREDEVKKPKEEKGNDGKQPKETIGKPKDEAGPPKPRAPSVSKPPKQPSTKQPSTSPTPSKPTRPSGPAPSEPSKTAPSKPSTPITTRPSLPPSSNIPSRPPPSAPIKPAEPTAPPSRSAPSEGQPVTNVPPDPVPAPAPSQPRPSVPSPPRSSLPPPSSKPPTSQPPVRDPFSDPPPAQPRPQPRPTPIPGLPPPSDGRDVFPFPLPGRCPEEADGSPDEKGPTMPTDGDGPLLPSPSAPPTPGTPLEPLAADDVFGRHAPPLHLPELDVYLSDTRIFQPPVFSDAREMASEEERKLFGYDDEKRRGKTLEVAGDQLRVPSEALRADEDGRGAGRRKRRAKAKHAKKVLGDEELEGLKLRDIEEGDEEDPFADPKRRRDSAKEEYDDFEDTTDSKASRVQSSALGSSLSASTSGFSAAKDMFPPLMLLRDHSLKELKSNAVGPRKPPGGLLGVIPPFSSLLSTLIDFIVGVEGSSFAAGIFRLELIGSFIQIMRMNLHFVQPVRGPDATLADKFKNVFLFYLPSFLALDFASLFGRAVIFLLVWMILVALLLVHFWRMTKARNPNRTIEGFSNQPWLFRPPSLGSKAGNILTVFTLTMLYLPLSKLSVDLLTWSSAYWPVANPYVNGVDHPNPPALGDPNLFRDPLDFCWTTTMKRDEFNFAWVLLPFGALTLIFYTLLWPLLMVKALKELLPRVSRFNELGNRRSDEEMEHEYIRLVNADKSPMAFMFNDYRRRWGFYKPIYILCFKLTTLLVIGVFTKNNCLWRSFEQRTMLISQQATLIALTGTLLVVHLWVRPFVDPISNRSELVSRSGYLATALIGLLVALNVEGSTVYNTTILYIIQAFTYTGNVYFSLAGADWCKHLVKRWQRRLDFSVDVFSPHLDLYKHIKRRVWEETLSTVLLAGSSYHMPEEQVVAFSVAEAWPPYLLYFQGSAAERHVENIKILKQIGIKAYAETVAELRGPRSHRWRAAAHAISTHYAGPDAYWRPLRPPFPPGVSSFFGKAFLIPFPPTLVIRYDQAGEDGADGEPPTVQLTTLEELEAFVEQNTSHAVRDRRWTRLALRALDGMTVFCPHIEAQPMRDDGMAPFRTEQRYTFARPVSYTYGVLSVRTRGHTSPWQEDPHLAPGFEVTVTFADGRRQDPEGVTCVAAPIVVDGASAFSLTDDLAMTPGLSRFLQDNEGVIRARMPLFESVLRAYRRGFMAEARLKTRVMDYAFLSDVWDNASLERSELRRALANSSSCRAVRELPKRYPASLALLYERLEAINRSRVHQWWWLLWDDLWRKNSTEYRQLRKHRRSFHPGFATSIAYQPLCRHGLEVFLQERGLWKGGEEGRKYLFNDGTLNRIYFHLTTLISTSTHGLAPVDEVRMGTSPSLDTCKMSHPVGMQPHTLASILAASASAADLNDSRLTGAGTAHSETQILNRRAWTWTEQRLAQPKRSRWKRLSNSVLEWLAVRPYRMDPEISSLHFFLKRRREVGGEEGAKPREWLEVP